MSGFPFIDVDTILPAFPVEKNLALAFRGSEFAQTYQDIAEEWRIKGYTLTKPDDEFFEASPNTIGTYLDEPSGFTDEWNGYFIGNRPESHNAYNTFYTVCGFHLGLQEDWLSRWTDARNGVPVDGFTYPTQNILITELVIMRMAVLQAFMQCQNLLCLDNRGRPATGGS